MEKKNPYDILIQAYVGNDGFKKTVKGFFVSEKILPDVETC
jgi:hypothetical protein